MFTNLEPFWDFVRQHQADDPIKLLLQQNKYPDVDMRLVAQQIEGQRQALAKWPTLALFDRVLYPPKLNREQSSSEYTARYKADNFVLPNWHIADLTGGMGIDSMAFAKAAQTVDYVEHDPTLCQIMQHNCAAMGIANVACHNTDSIEWLKSHDRHFNLLFIDPARRSAQGKKVSAFEECTPNLLDNLDTLLSHCDTLLVKASPMIDITLGTQQLRDVKEIHIVAVEGECKEVLFCCQNNYSKEPTIHCIDLQPKTQTSDKFIFTRQEETANSATYSSKIATYLYEPNATLMKGGPFALIGHRYHLGKLSRNTHLYTSDSIEQDFPGRIFSVLQEVQLNKKSVSKILPDKKAHVISRNYPIGAAELQKQLGLQEGGEHFIIATTIGEKKTGFLCQPMKIINNFIKK